MNTSNIIGWSKSSDGHSFIRGFDPKNQQELSTEYAVATKEEVEKACELAQQAFQKSVGLSGQRKADFLNRIASRTRPAGQRHIE